jgi:hypothetical protein
MDQAEDENGKHDEADHGVEGVSLTGEADDGEGDTRYGRRDQNQQA